MSNELPELAQIQEFYARRNHLLKETQRGLTTDRCLGYHGTSIQAFLHGLKHGTIPGKTDYHNYPPHLPQPGDIYFFPIEEDTAIKFATSHAWDIARRHAAITTLGLSLKDSRLNNALGEMSPTYYAPEESYADYDKLIKDFPGKFRTQEEYLREYVDKPINEIAEFTGKTPVEIRHALDSAIDCNGIIFGIDQDVEYNTSFNIGEGDPGNGDKRVQTRTGFPIRYIRGIMPVGPREQEFFRLLSQVR